MSQSRKHRGMRSQLLVSQWLKRHGWPWAEPAGSGRSGADVTGTPDIAVEVKARTELSPLAWTRQAEAAADGRLPFVVFRPNGMGEDVGRWLVMARMDAFTDLLRRAEYGDGSPIEHQEER